MPDLDLFLISVWFACCSRATPMATPMAIPTPMQIARLSIATPNARADGCPQADAQPIKLPLGLLGVGGRAVAPLYVVWLRHCVPPALLPLIPELKQTVDVALCTFNGDVGFLYCPAIAPAIVPLIRYWRAKMKSGTRAAYRASPLRSTCHSQDWYRQSRKRPSGIKNLSASESKIRGRKASPMRR